MKAFTIATVFLVIIAVFILRAPAYLAYSELPRKSDAVVLFLGNEYKERRAEAVHLIRNGYADYLLIPAYGKMVEAPNLERASRNVVPARPPQYPILYEDTHIEVLEAKKLMDKKGLKSAIFVSSPYHMRRIRLIAGKVFAGPGYRMAFVPTRFEKQTNGLWFLHQSDIRKVVSEYCKIAWFSLYRWFK